MASIVAAWPTVALGEVIRQRKEFVQIDDLAEYKRCRVQLHAQGVVLRDVVVGAEVKTKSQQLCRTSEFLVAEIDAKVGGFGIVPHDLHGAIVSSHYFLFVVEETRLDRRFLDYYIRTHDFMGQVEAQGSTNYAAIRPADVLRYTIPLPPLDEQRRIVARIEELAARIEEARGLRREAMAEVTALVPSAVTLQFDALRSHYESVELLELCRFVGGSQPPKSMFRYEPMPGYIRFLQIRDYSSDDHVTYIPESPLNRLAKPEDVLIARYGSANQGASSLGRVLRGKEGAYNVAICRAVPLRDDLDLDFLAIMLTYGPFQGRLQELSRTVQSGFNRGDLVGVRYPLPSIDEQKSLAAYVGELRDRTEKVGRIQEDTRVELDTLLPSVLDQAFRGEL